MKYLSNLKFNQLIYLLRRCNKILIFEVYLKQYISY